MGKKQKQIILEFSALIMGSVLGPVLTIAACFQLMANEPVTTLYMEESYTESATLKRAPASADGPCQDVADFREQKSCRSL